jgi:iron complex transport system substrate-binding protein
VDGGGNGRAGGVLIFSREDAKMLHPDDLEAVARTAVDCGFHIHTEFGPGLLETAYEALMAEALRQAGLAVKRQVSVPLVYKSVVVDNAFKIDLLVEESLIIELKSVEKLAPVHGKQVLTYLRLANLRLGLLMNFGQAMFKDGIRRVVNDHRNGRYGD